MQKPKKNIRLFLVKLYKFTNYKIKNFKQKIIEKEIEIIQEKLKNKKKNREFRTFFLVKPVAISGLITKMGLKMMCWSSQPSHILIKNYACFFAF